jgi:hypothetical protein
VCPKITNLSLQPRFFGPLISKTVSDHLKMILTITLNQLIASL